MNRALQSRRRFLSIAMASGVSLLAACGGPPPTPTAAPKPVQPAAEPTKPAAPVATKPAAPAAEPTKPAAPPAPTAAVATKPAAPTAAVATKPAAAAPAGSAPVTIDWWVPNFHAAGAKPMKERFEAAHPNIKLNQVETVSQGLFEKTLAMLNATQQPEIVDVAVGWNPVFSQAGLVRDLSARQIDKSDWLEGPLATATYQGKLFGVPFRSEAVALIWNKGIFESAGLDPNKPPDTWEELVSMAVKAHKPPERYGFGLVAGNYGNMIFRMLTFIWANEGDIISADYTKAVCNEPACVEATQFWTDMATKHKVQPEIALTADTAAMDELFTAGKVALHITGQYIRPRLAQNAPNLKWGARPTLKRKKIQGPLGGWNFVVPKNAKNPDAAWTAIEFMTQPDNLAFMTDKIGVFPSRKSALNSDLFKKQTELAPFAEQLQYARAQPALQQWEEVQKIFGTNVQAVIAGQKQVQPAMDQAAADIDKILKK